MSDFSAYHALGDQRDQERRQAPPGGGQPPPQPYPYQQAAPPGQQQQQQQQQHGTPWPPQGGFAPPGAPPPGGVTDLSAQMAATHLGGSGEPAPPSRAGKRRDRHAYHTLEPAPGSSLAYNGMPPPGSPLPSLGPQQTGAAAAAHPYAGQSVTSAMSQFPAPAPGAPAYGASGPAPHHSAPAPAAPGAAIETGGGATGPGRVDPEQIPSVPRARDTAAAHYRAHYYATMQQHLPPPAAVPYAAIDEGPAAPRLARLTLNSVPATAEALAATALPLGLVLQPLAPPAPGEPAVPVLDFTGGDREGEEGALAGPPRCARCRTYVNPFMHFAHGGAKFVCNMCAFPNDVPPAYFAPADPHGVRVDRDQRPELRFGAVEFAVPRAYWAKPPVGLRHLFVLDVSQEAVNRGWLEAVCDAILGALYGDGDGEEEEDDEEAEESVEPPEGQEDGQRRRRIKRAIPEGAKPNLNQAQMMVMPDSEEPFVALGSDGLFVDPYEARAVITSLLAQLPRLFADVKQPEPALLTALNAAVDALQATGGKVLAALAALPTWGQGRLFMRDDGKLHGLESERKLFATEHPAWRRAAARAVEHGVGVDLFVAAFQGVYLDLATVGHVGALGGGETFHYPNFHPPRDGLRLALDVRHAVARESGFQALLKVRCSNGLQVAAYYGNLHQPGGSGGGAAADVELATVDADKALAVLFAHDGRLDAQRDAHFQCALLYTTAAGQRRVRCINSVASVCEAPAEAMRFVDQDAVVTLIAKEAASRMTERTLKDVRTSITEKTIDILAGYRKIAPSNHPPGQLVLPENLKEFAMYMLSLLKCRAFKAGSEPSDRRTHTMRLLRGGSPLAISLLLYPRLLALHDLKPEAGFPAAEDPTHLHLPSHLRASFGRVRPGGAYLATDGQTLLLWLHAQVSPHLLEDLFGPAAGEAGLAGVDAVGQAALPVLPTHLSAQARNLLAYWGSCAPGALGSARALAASSRGSGGESDDGGGGGASRGGRYPVQVARQGLDGAELEFARLLVEDRNGEAQSYVDWLVHVHRGVQLELQGQRSRARDDGAGEGALAGGLRAMGWSTGT